MLKSKVWFSLVLLLALSMLLAVGCAQPDVAPDPDVDVPVDDDTPEAPVDGLVVTVAAGARRRLPQLNRHRISAGRENASRPHPHRSRAFAPVAIHASNSRFMLEPQRIDHAPRRFWRSAMVLL